MKNLRRDKSAVILGAAALLALTGCIDDSYDLENIDGTIKVEVKDLVVPVQLDPVEFSSVIDITDEECIDVNANGEYVLIKDGEFTEFVNIKSISATPVVKNNTALTPVPLVNNVAVDVPADQFSFSYSDNVDKFIIDVEWGRVDFDITLTVNLENESHRTVYPCRVEDMVFTLPDGLYGYYISQGKRVDVTPESAEHVARFNGVVEAAADGKITFVYHVTDADFNSVDASFSDGSISYNGHIGIAGGKILPLSTISTPGTGYIRTVFNVGTIYVHNITGTVDYGFTEIEQQHIDLSNLPQVLRDENTHITLNNPQLYLLLNNPMQQYGFTGSAGVKATQVRPAGQNVITATLDKRMEISDAEGEQPFLLAPYPNEVTPIEGYADAAKYTFSDLGRILYGNGLPDGIDIEFVSPRLDRHHVVDLPLGEKIGELVGKYKFYAPLSFDKGSQVVYTEDQTGWDFGTDEDLEITTLTINARLESDLPVGVELSALPLDDEGNVIKADGEDVTITVEPAVIPAQANCDVTISLNGKIRRLDGIRYTVRLLAEKDASALRPDMNLRLTNIRAKVSGSYTSIDDDNN